MIIDMKFDRKAVQSYPEIAQAIQASGIPLEAIASWSCENFFAGSTLQLKITVKIWSGNILEARDIPFNHQGPIRYIP